MTDERCEIEVGTLPILAGCPAPDELVFFQNAEDGLGENGFAWRIWGDLVNCLSDPYIPVVEQTTTTGFEVQRVLIPPAGYRVVNDSVMVTMDGTELARGPLPPEMEKIVYEVTYTSTNGRATINYDNAGFPLPSGQILIVRYGLHKLLT